MRKLLASLALASLVATPVWAATQTVTLAVPGICLLYTSDAADE